MRMQYIQLAATFLNYDSRDQVENQVRSISLKITLNH